MTVKYEGSGKVNSPDKVFDIFTEVLKHSDELDREKEHFWVVGLKANNTIQFIELVSLGILNSNLVHPREVFRPAIIKSVASIIVCHNHPSGDPAPSKADEEVTSTLKKSGELLGIAVLDHVIIGKDRYYSFNEEGAFS